LRVFKIHVVNVSATQPTAARSGLAGYSGVHRSTALLDPCGGL